MFRPSSMIILQVLYACFLILEQKHNLKIKMVSNSRKELIVCKFFFGNFLKLQRLFRTFKLFLFRIFMSLLKNGNLNTDFLGCVIKMIVCTP